MSDDPYSSFSESPSDYPDTIQVLQAGQFVQGHLVAVREYPSENGAKPILDLQITQASNAADNEVGAIRSVICSAFRLNDLVVALKPRIGTLVTVQCTAVDADRSKQWDLQISDPHEVAPPAVPPTVAPAAPMEAPGGALVSAQTPPAPPVPAPPAAPVAPAVAPPAASPPAPVAPVPPPAPAPAAWE